MKNENKFKSRPILEINLLETINRDDLFENNDFNKKYINQIIEEEVYKGNHTDNNIESDQRDLFHNIYENEVIKKTNLNTTPTHKKNKSNNLPNFNKQKSLLGNSNFIETKLKKYKPKYKQNLNNNNNDPFSRLSKNKQINVEKTLQNNSKSIHKLKNSFDLNLQNLKTNNNKVSLKKRKESDEIKSSIQNNRINKQMKLISNIQNNPFSQINNLDLNNSNYTLNNLKYQSPVTPKFNRSFNENIIYQNREFNENNNNDDNLYEYNLNYNFKEYENNQNIKYNDNQNLSFLSNQSNKVYKYKGNYTNKQNSFNYNNQNQYFYNINEYYPQNNIENNYNNYSQKKVLKKSLSTDKIFQKKIINKKYDNNNSNIIDDNYNIRIEDKNIKKKYYNYEQLKEYEDLRENSYKPKINKMKYNNNHYNFLNYNKNNKEEQSQINSYMRLKKNQLESMNYNDYQKQQFFIKRNLKKNHTRKKSADVVNYIKENDQNQRNIIHQMVEFL